MSFASLCIFTYTHPVLFLSKCYRKEVLAVRTSYRKEVLALLSYNRKEVLAVSRTQAQVTRNQPQEELLLADAKRSSCACIIFGLYCSYPLGVSRVVSCYLSLANWKNVYITINLPLFCFLYFVSFPPFFSSTRIV